MTEIESRFSQWSDDFFVHMFARRPVDATFAGLREYNAMLPDMSGEGLAETREEIDGLLRRLSEIDRDALDKFQRIDYDLAKGFLLMQGWERDDGIMYRCNPVTYTGEAAFALLSPFLSDFRPVPEKQSDFHARLSGLPRFYADARQNLVQAPPAWTERAIKECTGTLLFLGEGLDHLIAQEGLAVDPNCRSAAIEACEGFSRFLEEDLSDKPLEYTGCGKTAFRNILGWAHGIDQDFDLHAYAAHAEQIIRQCSAALESQAPQFGCTTPEAALARLRDAHPDAEGYLSSYGELWEESRKLNERERLVTWDDNPIEYRPIPLWARNVQPYLYFLFYRCPPRWHKPPTYRYHVYPLEETASLQEEFLRANNTFVIKTNHVLHHGGIGHHVQNYNAVRSRSRIAQVAANDGPARLTMLCGGTLCEGWACYISELAGHRGFLEPLELYAELSSRRRMAARAVVDIRLHTGQYSIEDAEAYYREYAKMPGAAAHGEAVKNSLFPGGAIMYLYGVEQIEALRDEVARRLGTDFSLQRFHDEFLSYGTVPVSRIAQEMLADLDGQS